MSAKDALHKAANEGRRADVVRLLATHPDPDARDSWGGTALHAAMFQDDLEIVRLLLAAGFDPNAIGPKNGYTPLHDAVWAGNLPAAKLLVEAGARLDIAGHDGLTPPAKAKKERKKELAAWFESLGG